MGVKPRYIPFSFFEIFLSIYLVAYSSGVLLVYSGVGVYLGGSWLFFAFGCGKETRAR